MGSFNKKGCFSNMPIVYGDRVVALLGVRDKQGEDCFNFGNVFTPISLPIRGEYDDYGSLKNIDYSPTHKILEDWFDLSIEEIVKMGERCSIGCNNDYPQEEEFFDKAFGDFKPMFMREHEYSFTLIMEHEEVFDKIVHIHKPLQEYLERDFDADVRDDKKIRELTAQVNEKYADKTAKDMTAEELDEFMDVTWGEFKDMPIERTYITYLSHRRATDSGARKSVYNFGTYFNSSIVLHPYKGIELKEEYKNDFVTFSGLIFGMMHLHLNWGVSNNYGQDAPYAHCVEFLETTLNMIKNKLVEHHYDEEEDYYDYERGWI